VDVVVVVAIVEEGRIDEVPVGLVVEARAFDLICEGRTLHEGVVSFKVCKGLDAAFKDRVGFRQHLRVGALKAIVGDPSR